MSEVKINITTRKSVFRSTKWVLDYIFRIGASYFFTFFSKKIPTYRQEIIRFASGLFRITLQNKEKIQIRDFKGILTNFIYWNFELR